MSKTLFFFVEHVLTEASALLAASGWGVTGGHKGEVEVWRPTPMEWKQMDQDMRLAAQKVAKAIYSLRQSVPSPSKKQRKILEILDLTLSSVTLARRLQRQLNKLPKK